MSHPYSGHKESAVGHRRAKSFMASGGCVKFARGGKAAAFKGKETAKEEAAEAKAEGNLAGGRLDKKARGGAVGKYQLGGGIHKIQPKKHKPHTNINITNISRGGHGGGGAGRGPGLPPIVPAVPPGGPVGAMPPIGGPPPMPGMKRGGRAKGMQIGGALAINPAALPVRRPMLGAVPPGVLSGRRFAAGGRMRTGKKYGEGSGEGRLEEYKHMKGK